MRLDPKQVAAFALYDFANSAYSAVIVATVFAVYYAQSVVGNETGEGDLWWGRVMSVSVLFVALSSPALGSVADRARIRKRMMLAYTCLCIGAVAALSSVGPGDVLWGFCLAVLANIGFEGALVYYNAYLPDLAPEGRRGFVSGVGFALGYAGSLIGLLIALPLVQRGMFELTWLSVAAFFALFSLPAWRWLPADAPGGQHVAKAALDGLRRLRATTREVLRSKPLRRFLFAYFFYIDGVLTVIYFAAIFATKTLRFEQGELMLLFMVVQISALLGSLALAKPTDRWGAKRVIGLTLVLWTLIVAGAAAVESKPTFFAMAALAGSGLGAVQAASRSLMSSMIPRGREAELFGFYAFCGKSSSVLGPLVFGQVSYLSGGNQRLAVLCIGAFFVVGGLLLRRVPSPAASGRVPYVGAS